MSRPRKTTKPITLQILPRHREWLECLLDKTHYGNSIEDIALNLLNERFKQLQKLGELPQRTAGAPPILFPANQSSSKTGTSEQVVDKPYSEGKKQA